MTLTGTNFISGLTINPANSGITISNVVVVSATQITATFTISGTAATGTNNVTVTTSGGTSNGVPFTVQPRPSITSLTPSSGMVATPVAIAGTNFGTTQPTVTFNGTQATVTTWSTTSITVTVPAGATTGPVVVMAGGVASSGVTFTVLSPDFTLSVAPASTGSDTVLGGYSATYTATATLEYGLASCPSVTASGLPSGITGSAGTASLNGSVCTIPLTLTTSGSTPAGTWPFVVTASAAGIQHSQAISLTVTAQTQTTPSLVSIYSSPVDPHQIINQTIYYQDGYTTGTNVGGFWVVQVLFSNPQGVGDILGGSIFIGANPNIDSNTGCYVQWNDAGTFTLIDPNHRLLCDIMSGSSSVSVLSTGIQVTLEVFLHTPGSYPSNYFIGPYAIWAQGASGFLVNGDPTNTLNSNWVAFPDFSLVASPALLPTNSPTSNFVYEIGVSPMNGFAQGINPTPIVTCPGNGYYGSPCSAVVGAFVNDGTAPVTVTPNSNFGPGPTQQQSGTVLISAGSVDGKIHHTIGPNFQLSATSYQLFPSQRIAISPGAQAPFSVFVVDGSPQNQNVTLTPVNLPAGVTASQPSVTVQGNATAQFNFSTAPNTLPGRYEIEVDAVTDAGNYPQKVYLSLVVDGSNPDFYVTPPAASADVDSTSQTASIPITVTSTNSFSAPITMGTVTAPAGITVTAPSSVMTMPNATTTPASLTVTADPSLGGVIPFNVQWCPPQYPTGGSMGCHLTNYSVTAIHVHSPSSGYTVPADGQPHTLGYCVSASTTGCVSAPGLSASGISSCSVSGGGIQATPSNRQGLNFNVTFNAPEFTPPGPRQLVCVYYGNPLGLVNAFQVTAPTPLVQSVTSPLTAGVSSTVTIQGQYFGPTPGNVYACPHAAQQCTASGDIAVGQIDPNKWGDRIITLVMTPIQTASGQYDVVVVNNGGVHGRGGPTTVNQPTFKISGLVLANGKPQAKIKITASINGGASVLSDTTSASGVYTISGIPWCSNVTMTASFWSPYTIPVTADNPSQGTFSCLQANQTQNFTVGQFTTIYVIHGIGQSSVDITDLAANLIGPGGIDTSRFFVNPTFDYTGSLSNLNAHCDRASCDSSCEISDAAKKLALNYLVSAPFDVLLVGYSMGGLIARDVLVNGYSAAYGNVLVGHGVRGLITLGTPNWGYPLLGTDTSFQCPMLVNEMAGSWNTQSGNPNPLSSYLDSLQRSWTASSYGGYWLAATGKFCGNQTRAQVPTVVYTGCLEPTGTKSNDGVVCADSANYSFFSSPGPLGKPSDVFPDDDAQYCHTKALAGFGTALMMGCDSLLATPIYNPTPGDALFKKLVAVINEN